MLNLRLLFALSWVLLIAGTVRADALDKVKQRGVLRWGGDKSGGGPYIYEGPDKKLIGFEVELAEYLAAELGVKSEFVNGPWDKLPDLLRRGDIDIVLNGYEWSAEREKLMASTIPYYLYKLQLMVRANDDSIRTWEDLRAKPGENRKRVGVLIGSAAERFLQDKFGDAIELKSFEGVTSVMGLVEKNQDLDATVQDFPVAVHYAKDFPGLRMAGDPFEPGYYVIFVGKGDDALRQKLNQALEKGTSSSLPAIYRKYRIWNKDQEELAKIATKPWPPIADDQQTESKHALTFLGTLAAAAWTTIKLSFLSMPLAMLAGLLIAVGRLYGPFWLRVPLEAYVELIRGTPLLLQLYVIYFLLPGYGIFINAFWAGIIGLAINYSAYEAENYRAGLLAIPRGQMEAALALGMTTSTALRRVIIPQAVRIVIPPVTNDFIALFKDTSVCSVIAVTELTGRYNQLYNNNPGMILELGMITAVLYLMMSYPLSLLAHRLEHSFPRVIA